jgi:hypothetical protein
LHGDRVGRLARQSMKNIVAGEAKNVVDALGFLAPLHRLVATVSRPYGSVRGARDETHVPTATAPPMLLAESAV